MSSPVSIRAYGEADAPVLAELVHAAVHEGAKDHYTEAQRKAWSPAPKDPAELHARLSPQSVFVARDGLGVCGFMTLEGDGHLDMAFVHPRVQGQGVTGLLIEALLAEAAARGMERLHTEASHLFRRFLERRGWTLLASQQVECRGVVLENHRMVLQLSRR